MTQNKKVLEFISQNGEELARHIFFNTHNVVAAFSEYFRDILKNVEQDRLFQDEEHAFFVLLTAFISIRAELEMMAIYERYGDDVYEKLGRCVSSYYGSFLSNYVEEAEETAFFLMHHAHETLINNQGEDIARLLALQFKNIAATDLEFSPDIFGPLMPAMSEGGSVIDVIEGNI